VSVQQGVLESGGEGREARVMKAKQKTFRVNRRYAEREFAVQKVGELIKTRGFEINLHMYKVVHIDDQDILFERVTPTPLIP